MSDQLTPAQEAALNRITDYADRSAPIGWCGDLDTGYCFYPALLNRRALKALVEKGKVFLRSRTARSFDVLPVSMLPLLKSGDVVRLKNGQTDLVLYVDAARDTVSMRRGAITSLNDAADDIAEVLGNLEDFGGLDRLKAQHSELLHRLTVAIDLYNERCQAYPTVEDVLRHGNQLHREVQEAIDAVTPKGGKL